jgi:phthiodiolone/phenolphthiodiolone dimycocerosates ketoreductase
MKVGLLVMTCHPWEMNEQTLVAAEAAGCDSVWTVDHLLGLTHPEIFAETSEDSVLSDPDSFYDPFVASGVLGRTTTLELGVAVTDSARRSAADVARSSLSLQHLCEGGFNLGVGCGEAQNLLPFGYDFEKPVARCESFLRELRSLLDQGRMPDGGVGRLGLPLESAAGRPKVWVAAHGPRMLRLTGQYGDGWLPAWGLNPEDFDRRRQVVARHAAEAGRPAPTSGLLAITVIGESKQQVRELYDANPNAKLTALKSPAETWRAYGLEHPDGPESRGMPDVIVHDLDPDELRALAPKIPIELVEDARFHGNVDELVEEFRKFADAGMEHVVLGNLTGGVGDPKAAETHAPDFVELVKRLREL